MIKCLNIIQETLKNAQDFFEKLLTWEISFLEIERKVRDGCIPNYAPTINFSTK